MKSNFAVALFFFILSITVAFTDIFKKTQEVLLEPQNETLMITLVWCFLWTTIVFCFFNLSVLYYQIKEKRINEVIAENEKLNISKNVLDTSGLLACYSRDNEDRIFENDEKLKNVFEKSNQGAGTGHVKMISTTGYDLFSYHQSHEPGTLSQSYSARSDKAPFHDFLKLSNVKIDVLLLNPNSKWLEQRSKALFSGKPDQCKALLYRSVAYILELNETIRKQNPIELRFYDMEPVWKTIMDNNFIAVQGINSTISDRHNKWYLFKKESNNIAAGFETLFRKKIGSDAVNSLHEIEYDKKMVSSYREVYSTKAS